MKPMSTPMTTNIKIEENKNGKNVNATLYRGMIDFLLYLTACRPDIQFAICLCARFQSNPKESHLSAIKRIMRYLVGTLEISLWYPVRCDFSLVSYFDVDYVVCRLDRKSTSGYYQFLENCLVF